MNSTVHGPSNVLRPSASRSGTCSWTLRLWTSRTFCDKLDVPSGQRVPSMRLAAEVPNLMQRGTKHAASVASSASSSCVQEVLFEVGPGYWCSLDTLLTHPRPDRVAGAQRCPQKVESILSDFRNSKYRVPRHILCMILQYGLPWRSPFIRLVVVSVFPQPGPKERRRQTPMVLMFVCVHCDGRVCFCLSTSCLCCFLIPTFSSGKS